MRTIIPPQEAVLKVLGTVPAADGALRLCRYCLAAPATEGMLLHHVLTRELVLLSAAEWDAVLTLPEMRRRWFVVPEGTNDREHADLVRWALGAMKKHRPLTAFTILPTTDCNARCFYCYEAGRPRRWMDRETALQTAAYIASQCGGNAVKLNWFGGEPLMNPDAIDTICKALTDAGIACISSMTTNGYLFTPVLLKKAVSLWNLKSVQITLDGTEHTYNRTKAYVNADGSAFPAVMENIRLLLQAGVHVNIRLNVGEHNAQDLLRLADVLAQEFSGVGSLNVYAQLLLSTKDAQLPQRHAVKETITERLCALGLHRPGKLRHELPLSCCMADSGNARVILPDGRMTLCEHHTEDEIIGHILSSRQDDSWIKSWAEQEKPFAACARCALYPECSRLKKCSAQEPCTAETLSAMLRSKERSMLSEYRHFLKDEPLQEPERTPDC